VAVVLFVVIGRASHHHAETSRGFMSTGWPFAIGLASGWLAVKRRRPLPLLTGLVVCLATVAVGMALRVVAGQGTAVAFVAVGLLFLGSIMIGGRLLLAAWTTSSRRPSGPALRGGAGDR
jgi:hypothetical protein